MGNGALLTSDSNKSRNHSYSKYDQEQYSKLERYCKSGYFHNHPEEYVNVMSVAIEKDALDCVEMLITAGDAKALMPIHLAAKLGKLESLELFLSAGFSGELADKQGRTPLHYCCLSEAAETSLCVSLLCLQAPKSKTRYDHGGQTPIHIAASHDNLVVLIALIDAGVNTEISSQDGKTALRIAQERKCHRVENHLRSLVNEAKQKNSKKKKKGASSVDDNGNLGEIV
jgi:ankyrin repeat protein